MPRRQVVQQESIKLCVLTNDLRGTCCHYIPLSLINDRQGNIIKDFQYYPRLTLGWSLHGRLSDESPVGRSKFKEFTDQDTSPEELVRLGQGRATYGPRAGPGPRRDFDRPAGCFWPYMVMWPEMFRTPSPTINDRFLYWCWKICIFKHRSAIGEGKKCPSPYVLLFFGLWITDFTLLHSQWIAINRKLCLLE